LQEHTDGRFNLSKAEVDKYNSAEVRDNQTISALSRCLSEIEGEYDIHEDQTPIMYILRANFYKWLLWFRDNMPQNKAEPVINHPDSTAVANSFSLRIRSIKGNNRSYVWLGKPKKELPELYQSMRGKFIDNSTTLNQFEAIFTAQPLQDITPIKWHEDNATELLYFILSLVKLNNIEESGNRTDYQKLTACFVKPDGSPFTANFKALKQNIDNDLSDNKKKAIDELVNTF
jgi:hypothetical protein